MGNKRAIIFLGTAIASLALVLGMITVLPTTTDMGANSANVQLIGHFTLTVADPDGTIVHYSQMDNYATDRLKTDIVDSVTGAGGNTYFWIAFCTGGQAANAFATDSCTNEMTDTGRCDASGAAVATLVGTSVDGGASASGEGTMSCNSTVDVAEGNTQITNLSINKLGVSDIDDAGAISVVSTPVTVFGNQVLTGTFTLKANN